MGNIITTETGVIGFYSDLIEETKRLIKEYADKDDWEEVGALAQVALDLDDIAQDTSRLFIIDNQEGFYRVVEYTEGE